MSDATPRSFVDRHNQEQVDLYAKTLVKAVRDNATAIWIAEQAAKFDATISVRQAGEHLRRTRAGEDPLVFLYAGSLGKESTEDRVEHKQTGDDSATVETLGEKVKTVEQALKKGGVDKTLWDVERFVVNSWEVGSRGPTGRVVVTPLWQVKVWLKAKKGWSPNEFRKLLIDDLKAIAPKYNTPTYIKKPQPIMAELSIFDAHFGKLAWRPESGQDYDLKICESRYMTAAQDLLERVQHHEPSRILYVVGNDFFHADQGKAGATTSGTQLDCDGRWQKAFRIGTACAVQVAEIAARIAPVDILVVPGNHDAEKSFCLGEVLGARFHQHTGITVQNNADVHSYYRWGKTLLGFVHGENYASEAKKAQLPITMATDRPLDWAETTCREIHLGHFHSEREDVWKYRTVEHVKDIAVRVLPSLSSTDAWHRSKGYKSVLAAECHLYHQERGRYGYYVHQVDPDNEVRG